MSINALGNHKVNFAGLHDIMSINGSLDDVIEEVYNCVSYGDCTVDEVKRYLNGRPDERLVAVAVLRALGHDVPIDVILSLYKLGGNYATFAVEVAKELLEEKLNEFRD